jgi:hypothetical protein
MYLTVYVVLLVAYISVLFYMARKAGSDEPEPMGVPEKGVA